MRDQVWKGKYPGQTDWFSGDAGKSAMNMTYDFSDPDKPAAICDLQFVNANGNRPFAFMSCLNGAFPKMYLNETREIIVTLDIKLDEFASDWHSWLRTSVVVALQTDFSPDRAYFEQDIKDNFWAKAALPVRGNDVTEIPFTNIDTGVWVHLEVPFETFIRSNAPPLAQSFLLHPESTFVESVYLVNECFGNGHIRYSLTNFWISANQTEADAAETVSGTN